MIKKVSIQLNQSLLCGGCAVVERDGHHETIFFDVVKSNPIIVIVGGRGKEIKPRSLADEYEKELLELFLKHNVPFKLGIHDIKPAKRIGVKADCPPNTGAMKNIRTSNRGVS
ncbi:hypothetical protein [Paenibacillus sp. MMO-58]|uniref:hypothetical protein n=1 Tax=Paenibacillus sp. MMO-58 TaxID=3081290 RepID=UPI00301B1F28